MAVYHADAIVIRSREFGESDRLITLFSREKGKIEAVAKGVRKPKSRQRAATQLFTYADFLLHRGRTLDIVNQAGPKESFPFLLTDLKRTMAASGMAELLDNATVVEQPEPELFTLTLTCFYLLEDFDPSIILAGYTLRLTAILGFAPILHQCSDCGALIKDDRYFFNIGAGGILCTYCRAGLRGTLLKAGSVAVMVHLLEGELSKLDRLRCPPWMLAEILGILRQFCEDKFDRSLKSWELGCRLNDMAAKTERSDNTE